MKKPSKTAFVIFAVLSVTIFSAWPMFTAAASPALLDPLTIPKYVNQLTGPPPVYVPRVVRGPGGQVIRHDYTVFMLEFDQQILPPGYPMTPVWGYGGLAKDALTGKKLGFFMNSPGPTFEAVRGIPVTVNWFNWIYSPHMFPVDPTLHWADPNNMGMPMDDFPLFPPGFPEAQWPVPLVTHLHGGEVPSASDGHPEAWYTINGIHGPEYNTLKPTAPNSAVFYYPNEQLPTTLWYHDHALGITRLNVMSGLAGFYLLRDTEDTLAPLLPSGKYEMPIVIQDRLFNTDGTMFFPSDGVNPDIHPYWQPEFFGDTIMVNGKVWPNMNVDRGQYRLRFLDGSNARFYTLSFVLDYGEVSETALPFTQIGSDGGYLKAPADLMELTIAPGERADILIDFSDMDLGTQVILKNTANAPFPNGDPIDPETTGQIMQFTVTDNVGPEPADLPEILNPTLADSWPTLPTPALNRTLPFFEEMSEIDEPLGVFLNGQKWAGIITELPQVGSTEDWYLVNPTEDAHPIHTHLTQFQLLYRVPFNAEAYAEDWMDLNGMPPVPLNVVPTELAVDDYLTGMPVGPTANEMGWKDTIIALPGWITVIRVRFAPQSAPTAGPGSPTPGVNLFPFDPTVGPGYVWHCHILDHEDNEMMRPYKVVEP